MNETKFKALIGFWRAVEALSLQKLPKLAPSDKKEPTRNWFPDAGVPWNDPSFRKRPVPTNKRWKHGIYAGVFAQKSMIELLEKAIGKPEDKAEEQRSNGEACIFSLSFTENGQPLPESS